MLKTLPDTPERTQQELTLQITLGPALMVTEGFAAPEVEKVYARARVLCQWVGETPQLFPVLRGLVTFYFTRAELQTAQGLGEQLLRTAEHTQNPAHLLGAHIALGFTLFHLGELAPARAHLERGMALYKPQKRPSPRGLQDPAVICLSYGAWVLWHLGYPDQALKMSGEALTLAQELSHSFSVAMALVSAARVHQLHGEGQTTQELAEALIVLSTEQGFPYWSATGTCLQGWALAEQGQGKEGLTQMRQGLVDYRATGAGNLVPYFLGLLAEAYGKAGQAGEGLSTLAEALAIVDKTGERFYEAELYRLKGELSLQLSQVSDSKSQEFRRVGIAHQNVNNGEAGMVSGAQPREEDEPELCFLKTIEIARRQQARSLELRAVMSLSRLWQRQGKKDEARQLLAEIYGWFTEGFDTKDLQEAKALLEELT